MFAPVKNAWVSGVGINLIEFN